MIKHKMAIERFLGYAVTVQTENTVDWMEGMEQEFNELLAALGDPDRVVFQRDRLLLIKTMATTNSLVPRS